MTYETKRNPVDWWKLVRETTPDPLQTAIAAVAIHILCVGANAVKCETNFSVMNDFVTKKRNNLTIDTTEALMLVRERSRRHHVHSLTTFDHSLADNKEIRLYLNEVSKKDASKVLAGFETNEANTSNAEILLIETSMISLPCVSYLSMKCCD